MPSLARSYKRQWSKQARKESSVQRGALWGGVKMAYFASGGPISRVRLQDTPLAQSGLVVALDARMLGLSCCFLRGKAWCTSGLVDVRIQF
jgi:hypothetical protein